MCVCMHAQLFNCVQLFVITGTAAHWASLSMELPRQEYWSRLPFLTPGDLNRWILYHCATWEVLEGYYDTIEIKML